MTAATPTPVKASAPVMDAPSEGEPMAEKWVCPWGLCDHDDAQACRADTRASRGCGGRFPSTTTPDEARQIVWRPTSAFRRAAPDAARPSVPSPHEEVTYRFCAAPLSAPAGWREAMQRAKDVLLVSAGYLERGGFNGSACEESAREIEVLLSSSPAVQPLSEEERNELNRLRGLINTPHTAQWTQAVELEAAHQQERWGSAHDDGKTPGDWFWLLGYLAGKALGAFARDDHEKGLHHIISTSAVLLNWHRAATGENNAMRPGIASPIESSHGITKEPK